MKPTPQTKAQRYSQELAAYTLRQFSIARSSLDKNHAAAISKFPLAYARVARAERLANMTGQTA
ncbi:hypothetical protein M413DRAFT_338976 [Hebeloma cylindrosporum]|uniref:Uncharacterized protein n=1 Tax=Hebeloma cylindrosporum TaxID=76867 RepID=A0A0C2Y689_HEBCY|nr:hypothetical protein M413DRAFT_338976 [Hebeloma cylindrosporum h7]